MTNQMQNQGSLDTTLRSIADEVENVHKWSRASRSLAQRGTATVFGSARTRRGEPAYEMARELGAALAERRWTVVTGGGPGIMQAARDGSGETLSRAVRIEIPGEVPETVLDPSRSITVGTFALRKLLLTHDIDALFIFPGGVGTFDELFEVLVHQDTGRLVRFPLVLLKPQGEGLWEAWLRFMDEHLIQSGLASPSVLDDVTVAESVEEALAALAGRQAQAAAGQGAASYTAGRTPGLDGHSVCA
ncbi:TIGR00730 family Rossman fold protein [Streptomyces sioyaensis]|uniref:TIGR00730 family Rossman fold protein n=1 Tax=Streptomyces sioyaensis TaxID=67364 RepID=UPI0037CCCD45